ncbi:MAG: hypothetical protein ACFCVD_21305 [Nodosilinea sp.]
MTTTPLMEVLTLTLPSMPRSALDELYHFLQYLQSKYEVDLEPSLESLEDEMDGFDADMPLQEPGEISLATFKSELGWE